MQLACSRNSNKCLIPGEHMFYFQQMFLNALDGIDTHGITNGVVGIASNTMFNSVAHSITSFVSAPDMFSNWMGQIQSYWMNNGTQSLWSIIGGVGASLSGLLDALLIVVALILLPITYALFALFYSLYGSVLYVTGPLVLALLPANGVGQLARTYLVNMLVFQAWGILYAIFSALMVVLNTNSVSNVLNSGGVAGFFQNSSQDLLLALASILFSISIALI